MDQLSLATASVLPVGHFLVLLMEDDVSLVLGPAGQAAYRFGDRVHQLGVEAVSPGFRRGSWQTQFLAGSS